MNKKTISPDEAIAELEEARQLLWDIQRDNSDADIEKPVLNIDRLLRKEIANWESKKDTTHE